MKIFKTFLFAASLALAFLVVSDTHAGAQVPRFQQEVTVSATALRGSASDWYLTFSGPVAIPGVGLAPGTYLFRRPVETAGNVIQVLSKDRAHVYAMVMTIPRERIKTTERHEIVFGEAREGTPPPIKAWFLPGQFTGHELIYPKRAAKGEMVGLLVTN